MLNYRKASSLLVFWNFVVLFFDGKLEIEDWASLSLSTSCVQFLCRVEQTPHERVAKTC
jgi:hypothetical protein